MINIIISAGISPIWFYPKELSLCYENFGNAFAAIGPGYNVMYIGGEHLTAENVANFDILVSELPIGPIDDPLPLRISSSAKVKIIGTQHGGGFEMDGTEYNRKFIWKKLLDRCDTLFPASAGNAAYWKLYTDTPVYDDIPPPVPIERYLNMQKAKFPEFTVAHGQLMLNGCGDRPMSLMSVALTEKMKIPSILFVSESETGQAQKLLDYFGFNKYVQIAPVRDIDFAVDEYISRCHVVILVAAGGVSMGRISILAPLVGTAVIASNYFVHRRACPELALEYPSIGRMESLLLQCQDSAFRNIACEKAKQYIIENYSIQATAVKLKPIVENLLL